MLKWERHDGSLANRRVNRIDATPTPISFAHSSRGGIKTDGIEFICIVA